MGPVGRTFLVVVQDALVLALDRDGHVEAWVAGKEIDGFQADHHLLVGHDWPVLDARVMRGTEVMPDDNVGVAHGLGLASATALLNGRGEAAASRGLHDVFAGGEMVVVFIARHPYCMLGELGVLRME